MALLTLSITLPAITPIKYASLILGLSIITALSLFKISLTSWASMVLIMVFSTGMMTLFLYVSSLVPNEKSKSNPSILWLPILILSLTPNKTTLKQSKQSMKTFSNQTLLILMTTVLILTMLAISLQSFNPHQSMSSTF